MACKQDNAACDFSGVLEKKSVGIQKATEVGQSSLSALHLVI